MDKKYTNPSYHHRPNLCPAGRCKDSQGYIIATPIADVFKAIKIDGMTFQEYLDSDNPRKDAIAEGIQGEPYQFAKTRKGQIYATEIRSKPLNALDIYEYAKRKYSRQNLGT